MEPSSEKDLKAELTEIKHLLFGLYEIVVKENASFDRALDPFRPMDIEMRQKLERVIWENSFNLQLAIKWQSTLASATYVRENIGVDKHFLHSELRDLALSGLESSGLFLEFGVFKAFWINYMAKHRPDVHFYGFDSFEGLPESWSFYPKNYFDLKGELPEVEPNVTLIKGWFENTLDSFLADNPGPVRFVDLDCDLYASSKFVLDRITPRIQAGTRFLLDDYLTQPNWEKEQFKAWHEWVAANKIRYRYLGYTREIPCTAVVVEIS